MDLGLKERVALVCGASAGLGRAIATVLASEGAQLAINGRDPARLERTAAEIRGQTGATVHSFAADVSAASEVGRLVSAVLARFSRIDILVCNAGGPPATTFRDAQEPAWQEALELSLLSTIRLCRATVPQMIEHRWGRVLCLTSIAAKQPGDGLILSTTARTAVLGFAKALADEVGPMGVTVNCLCPGYFATDRMVELTRHRAHRAGVTAEEIAAKQVEGIPARRMGEPEELAYVAAFLASNRASYVTGTALSVDGGMTRGIG